MVGLSSVLPPPLKKGGTIAFVAPGRWADPALLARARTFFEERGYKVWISPENEGHIGRLAGTAAGRVAGLQAAFANPEIEAVLSVRGGVGALELLDKLDYELIAQHPKPFVGFSDSCLLLYALSQRCDFVTYHGPMARSVAAMPDKINGETLLKMITAGPGTLPSLTTEVKVAQEGTAQGRLVGGNMTSLEYLLGTPFDWDSDGAILFIEDVEEPLYCIANTLHHLALAGKFRRVKAVLVGEMVDIDDEEAGRDIPYGKTMREVFMEVFPPDIPVCFDYPCGHGLRQLTLPLGVEAKISLSGTEAVLSFLT